MTQIFGVEIAYALPEKQVILKIKVSEGTTLEEAIKQSGILTLFPQINDHKLIAGIFGKKVTLNHILRPKDRVEIYRPLIADPKEVRKRRAAAGKRMKKGSAKKK